MNDATVLAHVLRVLLQAVEEYDRECPVETRLERQHFDMNTAMSVAREALARRRTLDGETPEYVTK